MGEMKIDSETLKSLICGAVSDAMAPYAKEMSEQNGRIIALETINTQGKGVCPQNCPCQTRLNDQSTQITHNTDSAKSAHHRIDSILWAVGILSGAAGAVANYIASIWTKGGGHGG